MPNSHLGELAALATAVCWTASALSFAAAGRRIGSVPTNLIRLVIALLFLLGANRVVRGQALPTDATPFTWGTLALSAVIGLVFGDLCLFRAFVVLGARLSLLIQSLAPFFTAFLSWLVLGELLTARQVAGMALTAGGVALALVEHRAIAPEAGQPEPPHAARVTGMGVLLGLGGALGQAGGLVFSKLGMRGYPALAATEIRVLTALVCFVVGFTAAGLWPRVVLALRHRGGLGFTALGAFFGPSAGVTLSLIAVAHAPAGVAASLIATSPLLVLPFAIWRGERLGWGGVCGAILAVAGVVLLVWS